MQRGFRTFKSITAGLVVALAANLTSAQVLKQVPDTAIVVVKVANLKQTSDKLASLSKKLGITQMVPQLQDPLKALEDKLKNPKGINEQGEMAFVMVNPEAAGVDKQKAVLLLLPVSKYEDLLSSFQNVKTEGGISEGTFEGSNDTHYIAHWGDYAAIAPAKEMVAKAPEKTISAPAVTAKEMQEKDLVAYVNFTQLRTIALPELQKNRQQIIADISKGFEQAQGRRAGAENGDNADPAAKQSATSIKVMMNQVLNLAEEFLRDTQAATWGVNLSDDGIKGSLVAEFEPNSYLGQLASSSKNTDAPLTSGLPAGTYLAFGGMKIDPEHATKVLDDLGQPVIKDLKAQGVDASALEKYIAAMKQAYSVSKSMSMGVVAPTGALGQEALFQMVGVMEGDADKLLPTMRAAAESQQGFAELLGQPKDQAKTTITPDAKTVDGIKFDRFQTEFNFKGKTPQEMQAQQFITFLYGPEGMNMYTGKVDDKHVLILNGVNDEFTTKAITAAKSGQNALGNLEQIKFVNAQLPQNRLAVMYIPVDNFVSTGVSYARQFGMPIQLQMPPNLPPIGAAVSSDGSAYRVDGFIPAQLVQSLITAGMQAFMAINGGGGGAQPGGPGGL